MPTSIKPARFIVMPDGRPWVSALWVLAVLLVTSSQGCSTPKVTVAHAPQRVSPFKRTSESVDFDNVGKVFKSSTGDYLIDLATIPGPLCGAWETDVETIVAKAPALPLGRGRMSMFYLSAGTGRAGPYIDGAVEAIGDGQKKGTILLFPGTGMAELFTVTHLNYNTKTRFLTIYAAQKGSSADPDVERSIGIVVDLNKSEFSYGKTTFVLTLTDNSRLSFGGIGAFSPLLFDTTQADRIIAALP